MAASVVYSTWGGQIVHENRGGVERGYVPDTLGSTIALVDSSGTITDTWKYWPYGEVSSRTGTNATPFTYIGTLGYFKDLVSSLTYIHARFYQTLIGQWMTKDPIWPRAHPYIYCNGAPINNNDPSGLDIGYGRYCGPRNGPGDPIDDLDKCCQEHDDCLATWKEWINPIKYRECQCKLCACAEFAYCGNNWKCKIARLAITGWSCCSCFNPNPIPIPGT